MLKRRLIPKLQLKRLNNSLSYELVTTQQFQRIIRIGDPVSQAKIYEAQCVDELMLVDIDSNGVNHLLLKLLNRIASQIFMPITVGGGIKNQDDIQKLLSNGADKVAINSEAIRNPDLICSSAKIFGSQCIVVSIDFKQKGSGWVVVTDAGKIETSLNLCVWASEIQRLGAGEILLTSVDRDGIREGLDLEAIRSVASQVNIPVIASGGCGVANHFIEGMRVGADAVASGTYFSLQDQNPMQCRSHIKNAGFPIRMCL